MPQPLLALRRFSAFHPGQTYGVRHLDLDLFPGERVALLGPNGAGKSTLLLALVGLLPRASGSLALDSVPLDTSARARQRQRRFFGLLLQDPDDQLLAETVEADVVMSPLNRGVPEFEAIAAARRALRDLEIDQLATRPIESLSLGQKRRVALASVLATRPRALLLDEPTAGLDHPATLALLAALDARHHACDATLLATHDTDLAAAWADRVVIMDNGQLLAAGPPAALLGDRDLCLRAGLRQPAHLALAAALLPPDAPRPASLAELATALSLHTGLAR